MRPIVRNGFSASSISAQYHHHHRSVPVPIQYSARLGCVARGALVSRLPACKPTEDPGATRARSPQPGGVRAAMGDVVEAVMEADVEVPVIETTPEVPMAEEFSTSNPALWLSLLLPLLLFVLFKLFGQKSSGGRRVLLFGPVGGGKTSLYHQLKCGRVVPTVSSMEPASASFVPVTVGLPGEKGFSSPVHVCDMPGTGRLRVPLKAEATSASVLVCVVDGTQLVVHSREAAGMLFDVFSQESVARRPPALLIAVNKRDAANCASPEAVRKTIEQEVQRVRLARTTMEDTSGRDAKVCTPHAATSAVLFCAACVLLWPRTPRSLLFLGATSCVAAARHCGRLVGLIHLRSTWLRGVVCIHVGHQARVGRRPRLCAKARLSSTAKARSSTACVHRFWSLSLPPSCCRRCWQPSRSGRSCM